MASNAPSVADITHALKGMGFPAGREQLTEQARKNNAPDQVISAIEHLPEDQFGAIADVARAYGGEDSLVSGEQHEQATEAARKGGHSGPSRL